MADFEDFPQIFRQQKPHSVPSIHPASMIFYWGSCQSIACLIGVASAYQCHCMTVPFTILFYAAMWTAYQSPASATLQKNLTSHWYTKSVSSWSQTLIHHWFRKSSSLHSCLPLRVDCTRAPHLTPIGSLLLELSVWDVMINQGVRGGFQCDIPCIQ